MFDTKEMQNVNLKPMKIVEESRTSINEGKKKERITQEELDEKEIISKHFAVNMDRWVNQLQDKTIKTFLFPLSAEQGKTLLAINQTSEIEPTTNDIVNYDILKREIQEYMETLGDEGRGFFLKLSCRSPKDVTLSGTRFLEQINKIMDFESSKLDDLFTKEEKMNQIMLWLYQAHTEAMHVYSAEEALDLFMKSRRIYWDLTYDLINPEEFSTHIIIRFWDPMPMESEFRVFVKNNKITAISQYFTQLYFPCLVENAALVKQEIITFWEDIAKELPDVLDDYVIDLAWLIRGSGKKWVVLEINPFNISTGAGLFSWESEADSNILEGMAPLEFRIRTEAVAHQQLNKVHPSWIPFLTKSM